jgi:tRNA pseudouridine13 synthase
MTTTPYITAALPGIGGKIKSEPAHFVVEEIPLYEPTGVGEHVYVCLTREGWTTPALHQRLMQLFDLRGVDIGYAGLKDKNAHSTQTFSLRLQDIDEAQIARHIQTSLPVEVLWARRHRNKLKKGHSIGNRFQVLVLHPEPDALARAAVIAQALGQQGLPNFYGEQRFGVSGENAQQGRQVLLGRGPRDGWKRRFMLGALQAELFNTWLTERIQRGWFEHLLSGDIAKKVDTGGLFKVEHVDVESPRFQRHEITYTGPVYGWRMRWAGGEPGALERQVLQEAQVTTDMLRKVRLDGSRRPGRLFVDEIGLEAHPQGLVFTFTLPKAAYATTLLREFMKVETEPPVEE